MSNGKFKDKDEGAPSHLDLFWIHRVDLYTWMRTRKRVGVVHGDVMIRQDVVLGAADEFTTIPIHMRIKCCLWPRMRRLNFV